MKFTLDNQTILYIVLGLFFVQLFIMRYYVSSSIEETQHRNNKKLIKKISSQIDTTFNKYMGSNVNYDERYEEENERYVYDADSVDDPVDDIDDRNGDDNESEQDM